MAYDPEQVEQTEPDTRGDVILKGIWHELRLLNAKSDPPEDNAAPVREAKKRAGKRKG